MPGHLLLYHPGVRKLKELVDAGELGDVLCVYGNRQNLGIDPQGRERALVARRPRPLGDPLPARRGAVRGAARTATPSSTPGVEDVVFCYLRFPSGKIAHMHLSWLDPHKMRKITVVGREKMVVFDDMELERKVTVYEKAPGSRRDLRRVADAHRRHLHPEDPERRAAAARVPALPRARSRASGDRTRGRADGLASCARSSCCTDVARRRELPRSTRPRSSIRARCSARA